MSLGVRYRPGELKPGRVGALTVGQATVMPKIDRRQRCYTLEHLAVDGFTLELMADDPRKLSNNLRRKGLAS